MTEMDRLPRLASLIRHHILTATTRAGSGHPSSSLSATDLMTGLLFGGAFRFDPDDPAAANNDRLIFSKGHASPLFYAMWLAAGRVTPEQMATYRTFGSALEGHPTPAFPYAEAATGSLGQGLAIGLGMALNARYLDRLPYRTWVLLGDSEMTEGSQWEAIELAAHYRLDNLIGILDMNRLGQRGATIHEHDTAAYERRLRAFDWETITVDGHAFPEILDALARAAAGTGRPTMVIARTIKGKGVPFIEDENGWHGKPLNEAELERALRALGEVDLEVRGEIARPEPLAAHSPAAAGRPERALAYDPARPVSTRQAYGNALNRIYARFPAIVSLDGEVSNSTYAALFRDEHPGRFFEMYIAEQAMAGAALGLSRRGKLPFVSTFAAFMTRAFDQIRMSQYSNGNIKFCGSHAGVSIGEDGSSQMGLEDIAMFRTLLNSVVLYPSDAISAEKLVEEMAAYKGIAYLRTTRKETPVIYRNDEVFRIGGCKILKSSKTDTALVVAAGITVHEALRAYEELKKENIMVRVIDLYSIKPLDAAALVHAAHDTGAVITVEDHFAEGGLGEAVLSALGRTGVPVNSLAVRKMPRSGKPEELLDFEGISFRGIMDAVREIVKKR